MPITPEVSYLKDISIELRRINVALNKINNTLRERRPNEKEITDKAANVDVPDIPVSHDNSMYYI